MGILVCGLNGSGKSTLGRALAAALRLRFLDSEDLYFPDGRFDAPRTREEFLAQVASRSDEEMRAWAAQLPWPVLRVDGTRPVQALVPEVCTWISETTGL